MILNYFSFQIATKQYTQTMTSYLEPINEPLAPVAAKPNEDVQQAQSSAVADASVANLEQPAPPKARRGTKRVAEEEATRELEAERTEYVDAVVARLKSHVASVHAKKRAVFLEKLGELRRISAALDDFQRTTNNGIPAFDPADEEELNATMNRLFPVTKVAHTVRCRNNDVFKMLNPWSSQLPKQDEIEKFAERDAKIIERYRAEKAPKDMAWARIRSAARSRELIQTEEEKAEFLKLRERVSKSIEFPSWYYQDPVSYHLHRKDDE